MAIATSGKTNSIDLINLLAVGVFGSGTFLLTLCILPVLPYSMAYAADHRAQAVRLWSVRIGIARYAVSKFIAAVAMGMLAYILGMALFLAVSSIGLPLFTEMTVDDDYACLLAEGRPIAYLLCFVLHYAFSAGLFAGMRAVFQRLHSKRVCGDGAAHSLLFCVSAHMQFRGDSGGCFRGETGAKHLRSGVSFANALYQGGRRAGDSGGAVLPVGDFDKEAGVS